ncbi:hypothetical protein [Tissierella sp.]|uniref:hypothetical protein n=1 Tax=Tissierella sp. TaxID=41274 RepID=UPI0028B02135|nr:hypothetical protein [Tissierella sp.]
MENKLTKVMLEIAIERAFKEIELKSKRGTRNLVDLGAHFAKGRFQKDFYNIAQIMLENENSPYYKLVFNIVQNVDHNILKTFGINLGLNSWTYGAKKIRQHEKKKGYNVPWTIIFDFTNPENDILDYDKIENIINKGKSIGLYSYIFFLDNNENRFKGLIKIFKSNKDCAFILFVNPIILAEEYLLELKSIGNILLSINIRDKSPFFNSQILLLKKNKLLFGVHMIYDNNDIKTILNDSWAMSVVSLNCAFAFLIPSSECGEEVVVSINKYIKDAKTNQKYPVFLIDFYEDITHVDRTISIESCLMDPFPDETFLYTSLLQLL